MVEYLISPSILNKDNFESNTAHIATPAGRGDTRAVAGASSFGRILNSPMLHVFA